MCIIQVNIDPHDTAVEEDKEKVLPTPKTLNISVNKQAQTSYEIFHYLFSGPTTVLQKSFQIQTKRSLYKTQNLTTLNEYNRAFFFLFISLFFV